jgi:putative ABC transport system permease protein
LFGTTVHSDSGRAGHCFAGRGDRHYEYNARLVTERTKEIGIRKSLGARQSDILKQFLYEAATLSAIGGIIGLSSCGIDRTLIVSSLFLQTSIPWYAALISIGVSAFVGIVAGLFPAWKAARLDPIEALRAD